MVGFLPAKVFTMLLIMAVVMTLMTGPLLAVLLRAGLPALRRAEVSRPPATLPARQGACWPTAAPSSAMAAMMW